MAGSTVKNSYEDFEPLCKWQRDQGSDTLEVHLPGFKKNELKIRVSNLGVMTITGEHLLSKSKWSRFTKEIKPLNDYITKEIHAKLSGSILYIVMPKKAPAQILLESQEKSRTISKTMTCSQNVELAPTTLLSSYGSQVQILVSKLQDWNVAIIIALVVAVAAFVMYMHCLPCITKT